MEKTTNFMNNVRTIARKNQFQYMVLDNYAIPAVRFTPSDYWEKMEIVKKLAKTGIFLSAVNCSPKKKWKNIVDVGQTEIE